MKRKKYLNMFISDVVEFISIVVWKKSIIYKLQPLLLKQEMEHKEIFEDTWEARENEWLPSVKNDISSTAFCCVRYTMGMEELAKFGIKNNLTLPSLAKKYFNSLRDENDEHIYTYTDPLTRTFVRQNIKGGRCSALNQI